MHALQRLLRLPTSTFLPRVSWLNDAKSPTLAEEIITHRYYAENARRRFSMQRFEIKEIAAEVNRFDEDQSLVWLLHSSATPDAYFAGVYAAAFPRDACSKYPELADELRKLSETSPVERSFIQRVARSILGVCRSNEQGIGPAERCLTGEFDDRPYAISAGQYGAALDWSRPRPPGSRPALSRCRLITRAAVHASICGALWCKTV